MIRTALLGDADTIAEIHVEAWRKAYAGIVPADHLAALSKPQRATGWRKTLEAKPGCILLWEKNDAVQGWICFGQSRDRGDANEGEIYALYVRPDYWRHGAGRELARAGERELWTLGCTQIVLWVLERNLSARAFYANAGFTPDGGVKEIPFGDTRLVELRYRKTKPR